MDKDKRAEWLEDLRQRAVAGHTPTIEEYTQAITYLRDDRAEAKAAGKSAKSTSPTVGRGKKKVAKMADEEKQNILDLFQTNKKKE